MSTPAPALSPHEWAALHRRDDGEQQPISPVEREFGTESHGRKHGLDVIRALVDGLGNPQLRYPTVHIGGSKGKGSTVAILGSILREAGYRVGTYTSPSLTQFGERIQINGRSLSDAEAERYIRAMEPVVVGLTDRPRFFEASTAIAFQHFAESAVDVALIEVGLGGRLDATNVVLPELAIITSIELEHTQILGDTLGAIAAEKAGIVKPCVPTVTAVSSPEPLAAIETACRERESPLWRVDKHFGVRNVRPELSRQLFDMWLSSQLGGARLIDLVLGLPGEAQVSNAALSVVAARMLAQRFSRLNETNIRAGLAKAHWPGRLELISGEPSVLLDVAHTPASARQLRRHLDRFFPSVPKTLVIGLLRDKKAEELAAELAAAFDRVVVAPVKWFRSMEPEMLQHAFLSYSDQVQRASSICAAIEQAHSITPPSGLIVVTGSLFAVGEAKRRFGWI